MSLFNINYKKLVRLLSPTMLRRGVMLAWMRALTAPVRSLYATFLVRRDAHLYEVSHSSQVCRIRAVLNDRFDPTLRRITIIDNPYKESLALYQRNELKPQALYLRSENHPQKSYLTSETATSAPDCIIQMHGVAFDEPLLRALVDKYRLASKNLYIIQV